MKNSNASSAKTSKLFHAVVVLGMSVAAESACSNDDPAPTADAGTASSPSTAKDGGTDAFAGWFGC
jgi:hypothetical protein